MRCPPANPGLSGRVDELGLEVTEMGTFHYDFGASQCGIVGANLAEVVLSLVKQGGIVWWSVDVRRATACSPPKCR